MRNSVRKTTLLLLMLAAVQVLSAQYTKDLFFVFLNTNPDKPEISESEKENLQALHLENLDRLAQQGILHAAGPFDGGGGMLILETDSKEEALDIVNTDPAVKAGRFNVEVFPFLLAGNRLCGPKKPYEMVTYQFVRLNSNPEFFGDLDKMVYDNRVFMVEQNNQNDYVVAYGSFSPYNDGMIIFDFPEGKDAERIIKKHPAVKAGQLTYEIKPLWIAKGTFCKD